MCFGLSSEPWKSAVSNKAVLSSFHVAMLGFTVMWIQICLGAAICLSDLWAKSRWKSERESRPPVVDSSNLTDQTTLFNCRRIKFKLDPDVLKLRQLESCNVSSACVDILNVVRVSPGPFCMGGSQIFLEAGMVVHCRTSFAQVAPRFLEALSLEWWFS